MEQRGTKIRLKKLVGMGIIGITPGAQGPTAYKIAALSLWISDCTVDTSRSSDPRYCPAFRKRCAPQPQILVTSSFIYLASPGTTSVTARLAGRAKHPLSMPDIDRYFAEMYA